MARKKKQTPEQIFPAAEQQNLQQSSSLDLIEEGCTTASCETCPFYKPIDEKYGQCKRFLSPHINSNFLTAHGPLGTFTIMPRTEWCGEHPSFRK
jgi:hypothetical protein